MPLLIRHDTPHAVSWRVEIRDGYTLARHIGYYWLLRMFNITLPGDCRYTYG